MKRGMHCKMPSTARSWAPPLDGRPVDLVFLLMLPAASQLDRSTRSRAVARKLTSRSRAVGWAGRAAPILSAVLPTRQRAGTHGWCVEAPSLEASTAAWRQKTWRWRVLVVGPGCTPIEMCVAFCLKG
jgi:hypothetical protein